MKLKSLKLLVYSVVCSGPLVSDACTTFNVDRGEKKIFARTLDWSTDHGALMINKRNVHKKALMVQAGQLSFEWTSKYGSFTFNQAAREFPYGGMNEKGLVVEVLIFGGSRYSTPVLSEPGINESQWVQYQLDNASTLAEAIEISNNLQIVKTFVPLHYFVCDAQGECGAFEYVNGRLEVYTGDQLSQRALANDSYLDSLRFARSFDGFGGTSPLPTGGASLARFTRAAAFAKNYNGTNYVDDSFQQLVNVSAFSTMWQVVYDISDKKIYFKTKTSFEKKYADLNRSIDYSCRAPVRVFDLDQRLNGDISEQFVDYSDAFNQKLLDRSYFLPTDLKKALATYVSTSTNCSE